MKSSIRISHGGNRIRFTGAAAAAAFAAMTGTPPPPVPKSWKSFAQWPRPEVQLGNELNESSDTHATEEQAAAVVKLLREKGFGGDGKVFPISTRIEPVFDEAPAIRVHPCSSVV